MWWKNIFEYIFQFVKQEDIFGWWDSNPQLFYPLKKQSTVMQGTSFIKFYYTVAFFGSNWNGYLSPNLCIVTQIPVITVLNVMRLFVIDQIVLHLSMKVIMGIVRIIWKLSAFVNCVLAQRKDNLVYLHFFNQGSYFLYHTMQKRSYRGPCKVWICPYLDLYRHVQTL